MSRPTTGARDELPAARSRRAFAAMVMTSALILAWCSPWNSGFALRGTEDGGRSTEAASQGGRADGPAPTTEEVEPNDSVDVAQALDVEAVVAGRLGASDVDVYRVTFPPAMPTHGTARGRDREGRLVGVLDARVLGRPGHRLQLIGRDGARHAAVTAPAPLAGRVVEEPEVWLAVERERADATGGEAAAEDDAYRLVVRARTVELLEDREPNDDPGRAVPAEVHSPRTGTSPRQPSVGASPSASSEVRVRYRANGWWSDAGDVDCFALPASPAGALLRVELEPPPEVIARLDVWSSSGKLLASATAESAGQPLVFPNFAVRPWESGFVACARPVRGEHPVRGYVVRGRAWIPRERSEFEPNDTREAATPLPPEIEVHAFADDGDVDWYRVSGSTSSPVTLAVDASDGLELDVAVLDANEDVLVSGVANADSRLTTESARPSLVRVRVSGTGRVAEPRRYTIVANFGDSAGTP